MAPCAAELARWIDQACTRQTDALEHFFEAGRALIEMQQSAIDMACELNAEAHDEKRMLQMSRDAAESISTAVSEAAPLFARHAVCCLAGEITLGTVNSSIRWEDRFAALGLIEALATSDCCREAVTHVRAPLIAAADRVTHDSVRAVREAARRVLLALEHEHFFNSPRNGESRAHDTTMLSLTLGSRIKPRSLTAIVEAPAPMHAMEDFEEDLAPRNSMHSQRHRPPEQYAGSVSPHPKAKYSKHRAIRSSFSPERSAHPLRYEEISCFPDVETPDQFFLDEVRTLRRRLNGLTARCDDVTEALQNVPENSAGPITGEEEKELVALLHRGDINETFRKLLDSPYQNNGAIFRRILLETKARDVFRKLDSKRIRARILEQVAEILVSDQSTNSEYLLSWLVVDLLETKRAVSAASNSSLLNDVIQCTSMLSCEPCDRGVMASAVLFALTNNSYVT